MTTNTPAPAHEAVLTDDEIRSIWVEHGLDDEAVEDFARAIESALLSKLSAPVADERAARYVPFHDQPQKTGVGEWCAPGPAAEQRQAWLLRFADTDRGDCVYYDEQEARRAFAQAEGRGWNCYLFEYARRAALASALVAGPIQWPTMPPSKGQSPVLFEDGYAEGWAKCMDECRRAVSAASAPVAGEAVSSIRVFVKDGKASHPASSGPRLPDGFHVFHLAHSPLVFGDAAPQAREAQCSCPSGDGSLRHPCAVHGASEAVPHRLLAAKHVGMCVDYTGLIGQARSALKRGEAAPALAEMLHRLAVHLTELGQRWYAGDAAVVDEFLQLYCIESDARAALSAQPGAQKGEDHEA